jgi:NAD(P)-dependent dehydrogenase (short-subunit alcohol dehydrogenase family)
MRDVMDEMTDTTSIVTGATSGIGRELTRLLAARGGRVIGVGRSAELCMEAQQDIQDATGNPRVAYLKADLSSQAEIRELAATIAASEAAIDVLVNNAGVFTLSRRETVDGLETQLAVNWLAAYMLTGLLLPRLLAAPGSRVVNVSSGSHFSGTMHWSDPGLRRGYQGLKAYDQSKLAAVLFSYELARRVCSRGPGAYAVDPGLVKTGIGAKENGRIARAIWSIRTRNAISPENAAASVAWCAADPSAAGRPGLYWKECRPLDSSPESHDPEAGRRLWELGESLSGVRYLRCRENC